MEMNLLHQIDNNFNLREHFRGLSYKNKDDRNKSGLGKDFSTFSLCSHTHTHKESVHKHRKAGSAHHRRATYEFACVTYLTHRYGFCVLDFLAICKYRTCIQQHNHQISAQNGSKPTWKFWQEKSLHLNTSGPDPRTPLTVQYLNLINMTTPLPFLTQVQAING